MVNQISDEDICPEEHRGEGPLPHKFVSFRINNLQMPNLQALCFDIHANCRGVWGIFTVVE